MVKTRCNKNKLIYNTLGYYVPYTPIWNNFLIALIILCLAQNGPN